MTDLRAAATLICDNAVIPTEYEDYYLVRRPDYQALRAALEAEPPATGLDAPDKTWPDWRKPPRYQWTETGMVLDSKGAYILAHMFPTSPHPASLDAAWAKAEAALPSGWWFSVGNDAGEYRAVAAEYSASSRIEVEGFVVGRGPTPAAALLNLAARLTGAAE